MSYNFEVVNCEEAMKNYFKGVSGRHIKDTLLVTLRNSGTKPWGRYQGYFKCEENISNYYFENTQISEDIYPGKSIELVLNFPRIEKNSNKGKCFSYIQLVYKDQPYHSDVIRFRKDYDLFGNESVEEKEEVEKEEEEIEIEKEKEEEKKEEKKEEKPLPIEEVKPFKPKEEGKKPFVLPIPKPKEDDDMVVVKKFRSAFDFSKADFSDEYLLDILKSSKYDFQVGMMIHLQKEDMKKEEMKDKSKTEQGLNELLEEFRKVYQLSKEDYPDEKIKTILAKKNGHFENTFEELMSFIE